MATTRGLRNIGTQALLRGIGGRARALWNRVQAAIDRADIMIRTELTDRTFFRSQAEPFFDQFTNAGNKCGMSPRRLGSRHFDSHLVANGSRFLVEIE